MITHRLSAVCFAAVLTLSAPASFGNDIVDFLRAINGVQHHHHGGHGHGHGHGIRVRRDIHRAGLRRFHRHSYRPFHRSVSIHVGHAPAPIHPLPVAPAPAVLPHAIGQLVTCGVPLEPHVQVINAHEIAPGAQPINVAVRDPHLPAWGSHGCVEALVYVQVFAPPFPPHNVIVSPCRTEVTLDYGEWEICIHSCNDVVKVEYDD